MDLDEYIGHVTSSATLDDAEKGVMIAIKALVDIVRESDEKQL